MERMYHATDIHKLIGKEENLGRQVCRHGNLAFQAVGSQEDTSKSTDATSILIMTKYLEGCFNSLERSIVNHLCSGKCRLTLATSSTDFLRHTPTYAVTIPVTTKKL